MGDRLLLPHRQVSAPHRRSQLSRLEVPGDSSSSGGGKGRKWFTSTSGKTSSQSTREMMSIKDPLTAQGGGGGRGAAAKDDSVALDRVTLLPVAVVSPIAGSQEGQAKEVVFRFASVGFPRALESVFLSLDRCVKGSRDTQDTNRDFSAARAAYTACMQTAPRQCFKAQALSGDCLWPRLQMPLPMPLRKADVQTETILTEKGKLADMHLARKNASVCAFNPIDNSNKSELLNKLELRVSADRELRLPASRAWLVDPCGHSSFGKGPPRSVPEVPGPLPSERKSNSICTRTRESRASLADVSIGRRCLDRGLINVRPHGTTIACGAVGDISEPALFGEPYES
ncbi:hypothetical protein ACRRTK_010457 [Alexandromys fortis]